MDVSAIIAKSRIQSSITAGQKSDELMLADLNTVYSEIFSRLSAVSKKYAWQSYQTDTVANQNEYTIPVPSTTETGLKRVLNISIKYKASDDYISCRMYDSSLPIDLNYTDETRPYFVERDGSVFVYPAPTAAVTDGISIEGTYIPLALESDTVSSSIKLAQEYHYILLHGLNMWNFGDKQIFDKQQVQKVAFEEGMQKLLKEGGMDIESGYVDEAVDTSEFE